MDYPKSVPGVGLVGGKFIDEDAVHGIVGSLIPAAWGNAVTDELLNVVRSADLVPTEGSHAQLLEALEVLLGRATAGLPRVLSFAQVAALTEDIGPIIVIGMDGVWEWTESQYFTGYRHPRCGSDEDGWTPEPLPFQISATGGTWRESDEKERRVIAVYREHGRVVTPANWVKGQDMIADIGGGNWKAPDKQDMFLRKSGTDADTANARTLGSGQMSAVESHDHGITHAINIKPESINDGQLITPTTAEEQFAVATTKWAYGGPETRPANAAIMPYIHV